MQRYHTTITAESCAATGTEIAAFMPTLLGKTPDHKKVNLCQIGQIPTREIPTLEMSLTERMSQTISATAAIQTQIGIRK